MEINEVNELRPLLFEALDHKVWQLYATTRSKKNIEEVREFVFTILSLTREYISIHMDDFRLRRRRDMRIPATSRSPIHYLQSCTDPNTFWSVLFAESISMRDIHAIRRWVWFMFDKILDLHCFLEELDYQTEHDSRYTYIRGNAILKPWVKDVLTPKKRKNKAWWVRLSIWDSWFGSLLRQRSWEYIARKEYDCMLCSVTIRPWDRYHRDIIRMWDGVDVLFYHTNCPDDPYDPRWKDYEEELEDQLAPLFVDRRSA